MIELFLSGEPQPQARPRARALERPGKKAIGSVYDPKSPWRKRVAAQLRTETLEPIPAPEPVAAALEFVLPRAKTHYRTGRNSDKLATKAPAAPVSQRSGDADNLAKAVLDELNGHAYDDDSQITELHVAKRYARLGEESGVHVTLRRAG